MYIDFEDHRPDTPRVPRAISAREGVFWSALLHGLFVLAIVFVPELEWFKAATARLIPPDPQRIVRFVEVAPLRDRLAPPKPRVDQSDLDRRSATRDRAPKPENEAPFMRGNTPEKVEGASPERANGAESPASSQPAPEAAKATGDTPAVPVPPRPAGASLGDALRNLRRYLQEEAHDNRQGGLTPQQADIQFDSKGVEFGPWLRRFKAQVESNWFVPQAAMLMSGHVVFQFYVQKDGTITELHLVKPASIDSFNTAAHTALKLSNPTMPLPAEYPADRAFFTVTFHYNER
jgi:outer membrane biosynthesis protein TonB